MAAEAEAAREARAKVIIMMIVIIVMMMMFRWSPLREKRRLPRRWERPRTQYPSHQQLSSLDISRLSWPLIGQCWSRDLNTILWLVIVSPVYPLYLSYVLYLYNSILFFQTLNSISAEKNSTIIFPFPIDLVNHLFTDKNWKMFKPQ